MNKVVDLHGLDQSQATSEILCALFEFDEDEFLDQIEFIIGRGSVLGVVLRKLLDEEGFSHQTSLENPGAVIVYRKRQF